MTRTLLALSLLACLGLAGSACSKKTEKKAAPPAAAPKGTEAPPAESPAPAADPSTPAAATDQAKPGDGDNIDLSLADLGVAKCTEYVHKMNACLNSPKFPEATREAAKKPLIKAVQQWKQLPPNARAGLAAACEQSLAKAKKAYEKIGCEF